MFLIWSYDCRRLARINEDLQLHVIDGLGR